VAKGFTPGGFDGVKINGQYEEETVRNYEAGIKSTFPDAHLLFNAAVYHYAYKNKQALVLSSQANSAIPEYNVSLSDQKATGVDVEFGWKPVSDLTFGFTAAYIDSQYTKFQSPALSQWYSTVGYPPDQVNQLSDLSGQPTGEPSWSFAANLDYVIRLPNSNSIDLFVDEAYRGATRCNDESQATLAGCLSDAPFKLGAAQSQTNARVGWRTANNRWGAALYVTNLFNQRYVTSIDTITASTLGTPYALINAPRRYGIELHAAF